MCSTLTARGADVTIEALRLGAVDYFTKPSCLARDIERDAAILCAKVKDAARSAVHHGPRKVHMTGKSAGVTRDVVIAIGASTGGVEALFTLLRALPADTPPILIVQHMPASFTGSFAARLNNECAMTVVEATDGQLVERGTVYIAPGSATHMEVAGSHPCTIRLTGGDLVSGHRPSADVLFRSVAKLGNRAVGAILTGMGSDGAQGLLAMRHAGARTLGQNQASCVVYGMPRAAQLAGAVMQEVSLAAMPEALLAACRAKPPRID